MFVPTLSRPLRHDHLRPWPPPYCRYPGFNIQLRHGLLLYLAVLLLLYVRRKTIDFLFVPDFFCSVFGRCFGFVGKDLVLKKVLRSGIVSTAIKHQAKQIVALGRYQISTCSPRVQLKLKRIRSEQEMKREAKNQPRARWRPCYDTSEAPSFYHWRCTTYVRELSVVVQREQFPRHQ